MKKIIAAVALAAMGVSAAWADGLSSLENFIRNAKSGRSEFTQVVTRPAKDGQVRTKTSSGTFEFARPDRFRFTYKKPFEQTIVADGQTLWLHDVDLNQVTQRKQSKVLGSTPAALLASSPDLDTLRRDFDLQAQPEKDGLQWVQATPKNKDGQLRSMKAGFRGNDLAALEILDGFGQRSLITFTGMQINGTVSADAFRFQPPKGADVVQGPN
ncbi:MAG: outer membrane lipoprotein chaperone LolA [Pseudomonadota bacterium]